ncbi:MAG: hypothetical protein BV458_07885 [Thermoplasmata archaeon M9B2D]|nr:MAG: hypothetical protein BV458_07885 [Thermoplasmata archaeon M9B2D]
MDMVYIFLFIMSCQRRAAQIRSKNKLSLWKGNGSGPQVWEERMQKKDILKSPNPHININI